MDALVFHESYDGASNGGGGETQLCIDGKVHVTHSTGWYDQTGAEERAFDSSRYGEIRPCDGSCQQRRSTLPSVVEDAVNKALREGFQSVKGWELTDDKKRYPRLAAICPKS